ncbi:bile acid:sodium symporter family protein [Halobacterium zhouii]|uniref:bile acid:sodium symporter family protein n=1 Tax=Halobacterium zhouii TaxID=2902624 RepID=UPI001E4FE070|nr:Na+-dependent transporter [Halobacterium zhouii]
MNRTIGRASALVEDYLLAWILAAVLAGVAFPALAGITRYSTGILAVMVGSVSLTLSPAEFRRIDASALARPLAGHLLMPVLAFGVATALGFRPAVVTGFVVLGAVTPELVTPVMTELADGDTALASTVLVVTGVGSLAFIPAALATFAAGSLSVPTGVVVEQLALAVVAPMAVAIALRARFPERVGEHDAVYPGVSAAMVVLILAGVAAANAHLVRSNTGLLATVTVGAVALNALGYGVGYALGAGTERPTRVATTLSVGMRDFAVAAALVLAAGLPAVASLPAVAFGVVEMLSSAALARVFSR